jgi:hypothetical protein
MNNTTNISDLPIGNGEPNLQNTLAPTQMNSENYKPINIHPNPYGISEQNPIIQNPQQSYQHEEPKEIQLPENYRDMVMQQSMGNDLPSRDIPIDNSQYMNDEEIQQNFVPRKEKHVDFLLDYEHELEKQTKKDQEHHRKKMLETIYDEIQLALFVSLLFFIFQTSLFRKLLWNKFMFLPIINNEGNLNLYGIMFKSFLFGSFFYVSQKFATFLTEL